MAGNQSPEDRELNLIGKVEMRIALADSDSKLEGLLKTYLAPLLLKLASDHASVRTKLVSVCEHINRRLKATPEVQLPVQALLKQFSESTNLTVRQFDILYIQKGLDRTSVEEGVEILPEVLRVCIPSTDSFEDSSPQGNARFATKGKLWASAMQFLLRLLRSWKLPQRDSQDDLALKERLALSDLQSNTLALWLGKYLLFDGNVDDKLRPRVDSLWPRECEIFSMFDDPKLEKREANYRLTEAKVGISTFLFTRVFSDEQRFKPAVILSSDTSNLKAFRTGDTMFKHCMFDLEAPPRVEDLYAVYNTSRPKLQVRSLALLSKSKYATTRTTEILHMINNLHQLSTGSQGLEKSKMRAAIFAFLNWTVRIGTDADLGLIAPSAQDRLKEYIEDQGWPNPQEVTGQSLSGAESDLRSKAYECIGILSNKVPPGIELVTWLFNSLRCDISTAQMHVSIEEALGRVLNVLNVEDNETRQQLKALLIWNMATSVGEADHEYGFKTRRSTLYTAVRYANKCLPFDDVDARYIDLLAIGSLGERQEIAEEGARGLDPHWYQLNAHNFSKGSSSETVVRFPDFPSLVDRFFSAIEALSANSKSSDRIIAGAVTFCRNVLFYEALKDTPNAVPIEPDYERKLDAVTANSETARRSIRTHLQKVDPASLAKVLGTAITGMQSTSGGCADVAVELASLSENEVLASLLSEGPAQVKRALVGNNLTTQGQAARVFGILLSHPGQKTTGPTLTELLATIQPWAEAVGSQVNLIRGAILGFTFTSTRCFLRGTAEGTKDNVSQFSSLISDIICKSRDLTLREAAMIAIGQLSLCFYSNEGLNWDEEAIIDSLLQDAKKESELAASALGRLVRFISLDNKAELVSKVLEKLYALQDIKKAETHFAIGEALSVAACGWHSTSTVVEFDVDAPVPERPVDSALLSTITEKVIGDCKTTKPSLKKAAAIWLLCLVQYCGKEAAIHSQLRQCQAVFARLLSDRDEIVQESGSRGLSLVYEMGDKNLRDDLVRDLVQSFTGSTAKVSGTVNEETQLFEAGALPTEGGNSVTTYKDIVSLANEMGDPSLVYRFMNLAANNAIWTSRAAFGRFGLGNVLADSSYLTENKRFYPKLYRYRFDPNPNVQRSMNEIWRALVKDSNKVIDVNFDLILEDLLKSILGKEWRVREASCAAIADLVQGREVEKYENHLNDIWGVAFKVLDDIKETVRVAAMSLCRTLTNLLIRNLEVGEGTGKRARVLLEHAMPFLLQQLESGSAKEVQQYAIVTLLEVVKKSPPKSLKGFAPVILETLVNSLSSLEHESINYLHLNADKYGLTAEKLDKMRVSSINASPVTEAIERCLEALDSVTAETASADAGYVKEAMTKLEGTFKTAIGLPSRVGLSRVIVTLVVRHNLMFRPYADRFTQLVRKHLLDRNETISVAFSMSLAYLMRLASDPQVQDTSSFVRKLYFTSDESSHRIISGEIIHAISKVSNDVFMRYATTFLPFAYIGRSDTDPAVRERFDETWKDNVGGARAITLYLAEIVELVMNNIKSTKWAVKHACCLATADIISSGETKDAYAPAQAELIWPILDEAVGGKTWDGKEKVILAYPKFVARSRCLWRAKGNQIKSIALREARRTNLTYRTHAIEALGEFAFLWKGLDPSITAEAMSILTKLVEELAADDAEDHMEVDSGEGSGRHALANVIETTMSAAATCVFQILPTKVDREVPAAILDQAISVVKKIESLRLTTSQTRLYGGAREYLENLTKEKSHGVIPGEKEDENRGRTTAMRLETFSSELLTELIIVKGPIDNDNESLRRAKIQFALTWSRLHAPPAYPGSSSSSSAATVHARGKLIAVLTEWRAAERSRPLQEDLEKALAIESKLP